MKKFLLSILVGTASYAGAYASNEIITDENFKVLDSEIETIELENTGDFVTDCRFSLIYTTPSGSRHVVESHPIMYETGSYTRCVELVDEQLSKLRSWNYTIESYSISYGTGW